MACWASYVQTVLASPLQCDRHGESSQIIASPVPPQPIPGSIASPATVATVLTAKYADGMPMYRLQMLRQVLSRPILDNLHAWLVKNKRGVMPNSRIGTAISYALGQWRYLYRYIDDGRFPVDNNLIERDIRPFTTGRKAWLFSNSVAGADAGAVHL